jgi:hypothetical protein
MLSRTTLIGAALLLSTAALGVTLAAARDHRDLHGGATAAAESGKGGGHVRVASEHGMRRHHDEGHHGRHSADDDDDDEGGQGGVGQPQASGPDVPAPDNGLFNGRAKPKVDVQ